MMKRYLLALIAQLLVMPNSLSAAQQISDYHWQGVERIVAVGDLHGDYEQYQKILRAAGLINKRGRWAGGNTHFVQTGDVPDRGPDSRAIIDDLTKLKKQAKKAGGAVHTLVGNHEAMTVYGDLRYTHIGEYQAFITRSSQQEQDQMYERYIEWLAANSTAPELLPTFDEAYRADFNKKYPLGYVEHRREWMGDGEYAQWVINNPVALKVNDFLFVHGGMSAGYCALSLEELNDRFRTELAHGRPVQGGLMEDPEGPLWHRAMAAASEQQLGETVDAILDRYQVGHVVIGHTPTEGAVASRFGGKVLVIDTGIGAYYGSHAAYLEILPGKLLAGYLGGQVPLPDESKEAQLAYYQAVADLHPENDLLQKKILALQAPPDGEPVVIPADGKEQPAQVAAEQTGTDAKGDSVAEPVGEEAIIAEPCTVKPPPVVFSSD